MTRKKRTPTIPVSLDVEHGPHPGVARAEIVRRLRAMIADLQLQDREVSFLLTDDQRIHQLNKVYRHKDKPTDVLAFAMHEGELGELAGRVLGDVVVSVPTARKQAQERGVAVVDEVTMLLAHGLLHLLGWDHQTVREDRRMRAETDRLCEVAGVVATRPLAEKAPRRTGTAGGARSKGGAKREIAKSRGASRPKKAQAAPRARGRRSRKG